MRKAAWTGSAVLAAILALAALPACAGGDDAVPARLSAANGWHGFELTREGEQCMPVFPKKFGATPPELRFLVKLANYDEKFRDVDCAIGPYAPLDQMKRLAVEQQNAAAARLILFAPETGKLGIDGEVAEGFANSYQTPVLMGYDSLGTLISGKQEVQLAQDVCTGMYFGDTDDVPDLDALIARLKALHMDSLAAKVRDECAKAAAGPN